MKRILIMLNSHNNMIGAVRYNINLAKLLKEIGYDVALSSSKYVVRTNYESNELHGITYDSKTKHKYDTVIGSAYTGPMMNKGANHIFVMHSFTESTGSNNVKFCKTNGWKTVGVSNKVAEYYNTDDVLNPYIDMDYLYQGWVRKATKGSQTSQNKSWLIVSGNSIEKGAEWLTELIEANPDESFTIMNAVYSTNKISFNQNNVKVINNETLTAEIYNNYKGVIISSKTEGYCIVASEAILSGVNVLYRDDLPVIEESSFGLGIPISNKEQLKTIKLNTITKKTIDILYNTYKEALITKLNKLINI